MYINAHDHLSFYHQMSDGISKKVITLAVTQSIKDYQQTKQYKSNHVKVGFGIHPAEVNVDTSVRGLEAYIDDADFIGEVGMDFYWVKNQAAYHRQREIFEYFVKQSKVTNKIMNIHTKGAEHEVLEVLQKYQAKGHIIHWYSGPLELVEDYLQLDCYFTISVDAGYSKLTDQLIEQLPLGQILTETDGPTALEWVNGQWANPEYVQEIVRYLAKKRAMSPQAMKHIIYQNYLRLDL